MPRMLFHRDFAGYSGGHGKVWDYFRHALALGWDARVYLTDASLRDGSNPWMQMPERIEPQWTPAECDVLFLAGMDWSALPDIQHPPRPVINLIQGVRHAWPEHPLSAFLSAPARRICVSQPVADAITATGRVNGPITVIPAALNLPEHLPAPSDTPQILIAGLKAPALAHALAQELRQRGLDVMVLDHALPRAVYLGIVASARVVVALPHPAEGFYLPALEAMALGVPVVLTDCIGSREYTRDDDNCLLAAADPVALADAAERALQPRVCLQLIGAGYDTARTYTQETERASFANLLTPLRPA